MIDLFGFGVGQHPGWFTNFDNNAAAKAPASNQNSSNLNAASIVAASMMATIMVMRRNIEGPWQPVEQGSIVQQSDVYRIPAEHYESLAKTVESFHKLDEDQSLYVSEEVAENSKAFIDLLKKYNISLPLVFAHGGDSVVFTWNLVDTNRYITTSDGTAILQEFKKQGSEAECITFFDLSRPEELGTLVSLIGGKQWSIPQL